MEFSKKIVRWAVVIATIYIIVALAFYYLRAVDASSELNDLIGLIVTGVIVSYAGKSGLENFQKIKQGGRPAKKGENEV